MLKFDALVLFFLNHTIFFFGSLPPLNYCKKSKLAGSKLERLDGIFIDIYFITTLSNKMWL